MFKHCDMKKIFIVMFLIALTPTICMGRSIKSGSGTRVNTGAHADFTNGAALRLIVQYQNPSSTHMTINEIRVFNPDGTQASPTFPAAGFPAPPFDLGPFESKGFSLISASVPPVQIPSVPMGTFQIHTDWKSKRSKTGLKSFSVVVSTDPLGAVVSKIAVEGFDRDKDKGEDDDSGD